MKILNKLLLLLTVFILFFRNIENTSYAYNFSIQKPIRAAVFLDNLNDLFISAAKESLENIQKENQNSIEFAFFDSKGNQVTENENIDIALNESFDLFVVNPITTKVEEIENTLNKIMKANIPLIIYLPAVSSIMNVIRPYQRAVIITGDVEQGGILEGKVLVDAWNSNREIMDKNSDNVMEYVMLQGKSNNISTIAKTKYSIRALNEDGIKTQELLSTVCNWSKDCAKTTIESSFLTLGNKIEAIISNNDDMAIGAIEALQKYGFNKGGNSKFIPVVGIGASLKAKELVDKGFMTGLIVEDLQTQAKAIYEVGMNLVYGKNPISGTNFKFDETGITIKIPYYKYTK